MREAQGIKDTDEDRRRDRNRKAMADAYDKSSMKARPALADTIQGSGVLTLLSQRREAVRCPVVVAALQRSSPDGARCQHSTHEVGLNVNKLLFMLQTAGLHCCVCAGSTAGHCL